ncbi:uncharacterized protein LOC107784790 [Nicotiana tabacum]|uniref:Uncharacterized protein LOC107784790 n=1 Tax=Nicotiana tabacum TaxID=4097 RepID=A0AC58T475_TOBAC
MTRPLPNLNQAYAMIVNVESQRISGKCVYAESNEVAMMSNKMYTGGYNGGGQSNISSNKSNASYKPRNSAGKTAVWCDYWKYKGHTRENCFKLHGYPSDFKNKRRGGAPHGQANSAVNSGISEPQGQGHHVTTTPAPAHFFTQEQYQQILHMLNKDNEVESAANVVVAGPTCTVHAFMTNLVHNNWIVDTCATNHMVHSLNLLEKYDEILEDARSKVHLPTGEQVSITHVGCSFFKNKKVQNILHIPEFKYNLLSVSKLIKDLRCLAAFYPDFCVFQELSSRKALGIGKEELGLYILKEDDRQVFNQQVSSQLVSLSTSTVNTISDDIKKGSNLADNKSSKQSRLPFPVSSSYSKSSFDMVHGDVWEPYKVPTQDGKRALYIKPFAYILLNRMELLKENTGPFWIWPELSDFKLTYLSGSGESVSLLQDTVFKEEVFPFKHMSSGASLLFHVLELVEQPTQSAVVPDATSSPAGSPTLNNTDVADPSSASHSPSHSPDYVVPPKKSVCPYPMNNHVAYDHLSPSYRSSLAAFSAIVEPRSFAKASQDPKWVEAMKAKITTLKENNTWSIVSLPPGKVPISCKWVFKVKYKSSSEVERYKARLMYVHNAFLQGDLLEEVYMHVPDGFLSQGECHQKVDLGLVVILVYVDDLLVIGSSLALIKQVRKRLQERFKMKYLGELKYFLGIEFSRSQEGIVMCQRKYALELVSELGLVGGKPAATPLEFNHKLTSIEFDKEIPDANATVDKELEEK